MHIGDLLSPGCIIVPRALSFHEFAGLCIEASGERSKETESLIGHLLLAVVTMVFVRPFTVDGTLVGQIGVKSSVVPVWCGWPFAVRLLMRDDVWVTSEDPERNDILQLEEMKSRKSVLINTY